MGLVFCILESFGRACGLAEVWSGGASALLRSGECNHHEVGRRLLVLRDFGGYGLGVLKQLGTGVVFEQLAITHIADQRMVD